MAPDAGSLSLAGDRITRFDPGAFSRAGVARIPEDRHHDGLVGSMTIAENLIVERLDDPAVQVRGFLRFGEIRESAEAAIRSYDVRCPGPDAPARLLSGGNIQKLILARVLDRQVKVRCIPLWLARIGVALLRPFSRNLWEMGDFFVGNAEYARRELGNDASVPAVGQRRLEDYLRSRLAGRSAVPGSTTF